jgi:hypothetical protein
MLREIIAVYSEERCDTHKYTLCAECIYKKLKHTVDRLCGLVVRVLAYRSRDPGFDSRRYQIFWEVLCLERGPLSLVRIIEELLEWK